MECTTNPVHRPVDVDASYRSVITALNWRTAASRFMRQRPQKRVMPDTVWIASEFELNLTWVFPVYCTVHISVTARGVLSIGTSPDLALVIATVVRNEIEIMM
jgi:hypothetical protein